MLKSANLLEIPQADQQPKALAVDLQLKRLQSHLDSLAATFPVYQDLAKGAADLQEYMISEITNFGLSIKTSKLDKDQLKPFFAHPYHLYKEKKDKENDWHIAIPKFIDVQLGYLERVTESHNVFLVNRYADWLGELPATLKKQIGMKDPLDVFLDGNLLVGKDVGKVAEKYKPFIAGKDKAGNLIIDKSQHFELLAALIRDGILPFTPRPIPAGLITERKCDFKLRDYQQEGWQELLKYSNVGIFYPPSVGKTFFSLWAHTHIKPRHLIAVPSDMLVQQWVERIELYTDLKLESEIFVRTYQSAVKLAGRLQKESKSSDPYFNTLTIDEVHHMPANEFSRLAVIPRKVTIGLSATPQREDNREEYIFALTGKPVGMAWDQFKKLGIIQSPDMHVWIVKDNSERLTTLASLLEKEEKTIIFCDSIDQGAAVAKRFGIPHIYGATKDKLSKVKDALVSVVSRVGDEGLSLPDITKVIEISWLFGSRRQELQRFTRLLHGKGTSGVGHIIMTAQEYQHDHKRLFAIMDRGFKIVLHRAGSEESTISSDQPARERRQPTQRAERRRRATNTMAVKTASPDPMLDEMKYPLLKYAGIRKLFDGFSKPEKTIMLYLLEPQNQNQSFSKKKLMLSLGYVGERRFEMNILPLVKLGYVKRESDGTFRQNFSEMVK